MSISISRFPSSLGLAKLLSSSIEVFGGWDNIVVVILWCGILHGSSHIWSSLLANLVANLVPTVQGGIGLNALLEILKEAQVHQLQGWNWRNCDIGTTTRSARMFFAVNVTKVDSRTLSAVDWPSALASTAIADICGYFNETHTFYLFLILIIIMSKYLLKSYEK